MIIRKLDFRLCTLIRLSAVLACLTYLSSASAALIIPYVSLAGITSSATWPTGTAYNNNLGIVFQTGSGGTYPIDWIDLALTTSSYSAGGPVSLTLALRDATDSTAYSARAGTTEYASDNITFMAPAGSYSDFSLNLTSSQIPNITGYDLAANSVYSLILYNPSAPVALRRATGAAYTANSLYTVDEGFTMINTIRNNSTAAAASLGGAAYAISFGSSTDPSSVPEPGQVSASLIILVGIGGYSWMKRRKNAKAAAKS